MRLNFYGILKSFKIINYLLVYKKTRKYKNMYNQYRNKLTPI